MKTKHFKILGCAALSIMCAMVSHAQSVSSTPVGYVTLTINGNGYTALSNPLENAVIILVLLLGVSGSTISIVSLTSGYNSLVVATHIMYKLLMELY